MSGRRNDRSPDATGARVPHFAFRAQPLAAHNERVASTPMRVLRIISRLNVGGAAQHVITLQRSLTANGSDSLLGTCHVAPGEGDMAGIARSLGITLSVIPEMSRRLTLRDATIVWRLWRLMIAFQPELVHTHTSKAGAVGRVAGLLYRFV